MSTITKEEHDELCVAYASMILFDGEHEYIGGSQQRAAAGPGAASAAGPGAASAAGGAEDAKVEEKVVEEEEEVGMGDGINMFGDEDY
ncbi:unnamed protein product [Peronospora destructor]|uniref:Uncharacterized protein n=1 Tax=Peronospora destructor TaxID=86335 RepID=A0AAV0V7J5_9STRA|nr:unnamed protein product [Peronospora destructor]